MAYTTSKAQLPIDFGLESQRVKPEKPRKEPVKKPKRKKKKLPAKTKKPVKSTKTKKPKKRVLPWKSQA
jgi:hypothetical protein